MDLHLSEVHIRADEPSPSGHVVSSWAYTCPDDGGGSGDGEVDGHVRGSCAILDADGDLCVPRKRARQEERTVRVRHTLGTTLPRVGTQVWRGALLLSDWLRGHGTQLDCATVLYLGAGCGRTSLMAARAGARLVYCTDGAADSVLHNAEHNVRENGLGSDAVRVRRLDWSHPEPLLQSGAEGEPAASDDGCSDGGAAPCADHPCDVFVLTRRECDDLRRRTTLILAADCVYDDAASTALVTLVCEMLRALPAGAAALFSLERRVCFCIDGLAPRAPAAEHFVRLLREKERGGEVVVEQLTAARIEQRLPYERADELELWRVVRR